MPSMFDCGSTVALEATGKLTRIGSCQVMPLVRCMGRGVVDVGDEARQANVLKLTTNYFIASMTQLIGEGMTLAEKNGVNRQAVVTVLTESFQGPITKGTPLSFPFPPDGF